MVLAVAYGLWLARYMILVLGCLPGANILKLHKWYCLWVVELWLATNMVLTAHL